MATTTRVILQVTDDLDGTTFETTPEAHEPVRFSLDGKHYELDLTDSNAANLREALALYVSAGRTVHTETTPSYTRKQLLKSVDTVAVRRWAAGHGLKVSQRGRIPQLVIEAHEEVKGGDLSKARRDALRKLYPITTTVERNKVFVEMH